VFDPATPIAVRVGSGIDRSITTNNKNLQPRVGLLGSVQEWKKLHSWRLRKCSWISRSQMRHGRGVKSPARDALTFTGPIRFDNAFALPVFRFGANTIDQGFDNAYVQSWNLNVSASLLPVWAVTIGYFGTKGTHLRISRNINQPVNGGSAPVSFPLHFKPVPSRRPAGKHYPDREHGHSSYNALWVTANKRLVAQSPVHAFVYLLKID